MDRVFLGLAGLLLGISQGRSPWEIPKSSPASPRKTLSIPPFLLGLTQSLIQQQGQTTRGSFPVMKQATQTWQSSAKVHCSQMSHKGLVLQGLFFFMMFFFNNLCMYGTAEDWYLLGWEMFSLYFQYFLDLLCVFFFFFS